MSYQSPEFKAKQFDAISKLVEKYCERRSVFKEYKIVLPPEVAVQLIEEIFIEIKKYDPNMPTKAN